MVLFYGIRVQCRRNKSSRSLSYLLMSFLLVTILTCGRHPGACWHLSPRRPSEWVMCRGDRRSAVRCPYVRSFVRTYVRT